MIEQKICDPLVKILLFLDLYFERYACLKIMSRLMSRLIAHEMTGTLIFLTGTDLVKPVSRPMSRPPGMSRLMSRSLRVFLPVLQNHGSRSLL